MPGESGWDDSGYSFRQLLRQSNGIDVQHITNAGMVYDAVNDPLVGVGSHANVKVASRVAVDHCSV
jgi:hypothetical protein